MVGPLDRHSTLDERFPAGLRYHPAHDWARLEGDDLASFGITWFAQDAVGEIVFFDPPAAGAALVQGEPYAEIESVKAVSDVIAPLSGEVVEVNEALAAAPEAINSDPYGAGWMVRVRISDAAQVDGLLGPAGYRELLGDD